jgi:hypothetical protein
MSGLSCKATVCKETAPHAEQLQFHPAQHFHQLLAIAAVCNAKKTTYELSKLVLPMLLTPSETAV